MEKEVDVNVLNEVSLIFSGCELFSFLTTTGFKLEWLLN